MEQYEKIQQLLKKEPGTKERVPIFPPTVIQAVFDGKTGASLEAILAQFNSVFVQYQGTAKDTRILIPAEMRRPGLIITYINAEGETVSERASLHGQADDEHWALDVNWSRIDELSLSGDIAVSARGTWIINGADTGIKAVGPKGENGITPWLKEIDNKLHYSYDNVKWTPCSDPLSAQFRNHNNRIQISYDKGKTWTDISDPVATYVRFAATSSTGQDGSIGKLQYSHDKATWHDLSPEFRNYLRIQGYVKTYGNLPTGVPVGTIYGVGPSYEAGDTTNSNPMYQIFVWNGTDWVNNGYFTSISAGIVQETGNSETEVMSQKAVSKRLSDVDARINTFKKDVYSVKYKTLVSTSNSYSYTIPITFKKGDNIIFSMTSDNMKSDAYLGVTYNGENKNLYLNTIYNLEIISDNSTVSIWVSASQAVSDGDLFISIESSNSTSNRIYKVEDKLDNTVLPVIEESPEYVYVIKDINNNILLGITKDGEVVYYKKEVVNIDSTVKNTSLFKCDKEIKFTSVATEMRNFGEAETIVKWQQDTWKDGIYRLGLYRLSWGNYEQMMAYADKYGITKEQILITNFPTLEDFKKDEEGNYTTEITDEYKNMVVDFIRRHNIVYYEMGNEQSLVYGGGNNDKVYYPGVTDEQVFEGWRQLYKLIKTHFPSVQVLTGAFHWAKPALLMSWLEYKYDDGTRAWDYFDIYSFHYYSYDLYAENIVTDIIALQELFQSYSTDYNSKLLDKKVWITEIGPGSNEVKGNQAKRLAKINIMSLALGVERLIIYKLFNQVGTEGSEHAIITSWNINKEAGTITDIEGEGYYANLFFKDICSYGSTRPSLIINDGIYYSHWVSPKYGNVFVVWAKYPDNIILEYNHSLGNIVVFDVMGNKINNLGNRLTVNDSPLFIVGLSDIKFNKL